MVEELRVEGKEEIRGYSISEIEEFVGKGSDKYIERFKTLKKFNWAAAFFKYAWFGYRKIYMEGLFLALCETVIALLYAILLGLLYESGNRIIVYPSILYYIIQSIVFGLVADRLYWRNIKKRIDYAHLPQEIRDKKIGLTTFHKTCKGTSIWSIFVLNKLNETILHGVALILICFEDTFWGKFLLESLMMI